jgi:hypothetical protein
MSLLPTWPGMPGYTAVCHSMQAMEVMSDLALVLPSVTQQQQTSAAHHVHLHAPQLERVASAGCQAQQLT